MTMVVPVSRQMLLSRLRIDAPVALSRLPLAARARSRGLGFRSGVAGNMTLSSAFKVGRRLKN